MRIVLVPLCVVGVCHALSAQSAARAPSGAPRAIPDAAMRAASSGSLPAFIAKWSKYDTNVSPRVRALALGSAARLGYHFVDATRWLTIAEGDTSAPDALTARAALGRASIELQQFNLRSANDRLLRAARLARAAGATDVEAEVRLHLIAVRQRLVGVPAALATADSAARMLATNDALLQTELTCRRAQVRVRAGDTTALVDAERAAATAARLNAPRLEGLCWQAAGQSHQMRDEYRPAAAAFGRAAERHAAAHDLAGLAASLQWRAFFQGVIGAFDSSQVNYRRAIVAGEASHNRAPVAWAWLGLSGLSVTAGEPVRAAGEAQRAADMMRDIGDRWGLASASNLAGIAAMRLGDFPRARERFLEAIARSDSLGAISDKLSPGVGLIDVDRELRGESAALARLAWVDTIATRTGIPRWQGERWYHLGLLALRRGDGRAALEHFRRYEATFQPSDSGALAGFDFAVRVAEAHSLAGDPLRGAMMLDAAISEFAQWRSRLSGRELRLAVWDQRGIDNDSDLGIATIVAAAAAAGHDSLALHLADARRARDLRTRMYAIAAPRPLQAHQALLEYVTGRRGEPTTLFVRHRGVLRSAALQPIDSLARRIAALQSLLSGNANARSLSRELGAILLGPALPMLDSGVTTLIVVPDGALHSVPWSALMLSEAQFVGDRYTIAQLPAGNLSFAEPSGIGANTRGTVVAIGAGSVPMSWEGQTLPPLPRAEQETRLVASYASAGVAINGADATEFTVRSLSRRRTSIVHFATHAIVDDRTSARAAILLRASGFDDGALEAHEIAALRLPVDLVVLAGCSTASGRIFAAEGVQGLVRPLLDAGARGVIASQWPVNDESAFRIVQWFYSELATGVTSAEALRGAQRHARVAGLPIADWASWSYVGDPNARPDAVLERPTRARQFWPAVFAIVALIVLSAAYYRTRMRRVALRA
jgi:CHAT domain-containing protein/tetratricopeptide (TPR) repeat protein